jgi:membrane fusion protein (multidrug efflux system)
MDTGMKSRSPDPSAAPPGRAPRPDPPPPGERPAVRNGSSSPDERSRAGRVPLYKRKRVVIPVIVLFVVAAAAFAYWDLFLRGYISTDDAYIDSDRVSISPKVLGRIARLAVDEGDRVRKDDLLVRLDDATLRAEMDQARADLSLAETSLGLARVGLDRSTDDFERAEVQFKGSVITREQHDHARQALEAAKAEYEVARSRIEVARTRVGITEALLADMTLSAPIDGVVAKRWLLEGDVAAPGQPIFTVYRTDLVWVTANLEETKLGRIHLGDPVEVSVDTYSGRKFRGRVGLIYGYTASQFSLIPPNNASGNFTKVTQRVPLKVFLDDPAETRARYPLRPGMSVEIKIRLRREPR